MKSFTNLKISSASVGRLISPEIRGEPKKGKVFHTLKWGEGEAQIDPGRLKTDIDCAACYDRLNLARFRLNAAARQLRLPPPCAPQGCLDIAVRSFKLSNSARARGRGRDAYRGDNGTALIVACSADGKQPFYPLHRQRGLGSAADYTMPAGVTDWFCRNDELVLILADDRHGTIMDTVVIPKKSFDGELPLADGSRVWINVQFTQE